MKKTKAEGIIKVVLALVCCTVLAFTAVGLHRGAPAVSEADRVPVSPMKISDKDILYDRDSIDRLGHAPAEDGNEPETEDSEPNDSETEAPTESVQNDPDPDTEQPEDTDSSSGEQISDETSPDASDGDESSPELTDPDKPGTIPTQSDNISGELPDLPGKLTGIGGSEPGDRVPEDKPGENPGDGGTGSFENYFTTSIIDNDILTNENYTFTITHLKTELTVSGISVTVNGAEQTYRGIDNSFRITLSEGVNSVLVKVIYFDGEVYITAARSYTLYKAADDAVLIITDLENIHETSQAKLPFTAYAVKGTKRLGVSVRVNGKALTPSGDSFTAELEYGENTVTITAGGRSDSVTKQYTVVYREDIFKITTTISDTVITNDTAQPDYKYEELTVRADTEFYKFKVFVNPVTGKEQLRHIRFDGKLVTVGGDGYYTVELSQRKPFYLGLYYTNSDGENRSYRYLLRFRRNGESTPENKYPTVYAQVEIGDTVINLENGLTFKNPDIITNVTALSFDNEQLYYNNFSVFINGKKIEQHCSQTGAWFGFNTYLTREGENTITVTVSDNDGYAVTKSWRVYYQPGNIKVKVSVEATTVGLGYLIPPTEVEVPGRTSVMEIVTALLEQNGFSCNTNGGTYLSDIGKPGLCSRYRIDPELMRLILADGMDETGAGEDPCPASPDRLGEFDFYRWSGWMYSCNGKYPGYGMNVCKPQDGAVIRLRFTLAMGKDIGGFRPDQGGMYGVTAGNYYKEW